MPGHSHHPNHPRPSHHYPHSSQPPHQPTPTQHQPFVLTLHLDPTTSKTLTTLRQKYYPTHLNVLAAHITLFHALPANAQPQIANILRNITSQTKTFRCGLKNPFMLGKKGVGINVASFKLKEFHKELLYRFREARIELTEQDQSPIHPHITVQNKVDEEEARRTLEAVQEEFSEQVALAQGVVVWRYEQNGGWTHLKTYEFPESHT